MTAHVYDMDLVEYHDGEAFFEHYQAADSDVSLVLPLSNWDRLGRPGAIRVSIEEAK